MFWIDQKYANLLQPYVRNFKRKTENLFNFSCPYCEDSSRNSLKARGYLFKTKTGLMYHCHNCSISANIGNVLKQVSYGLYQEYQLESYKEGGFSRARNIVLEEIPDIFFNTPLSKANVLNNATNLSKLDSNHIAVNYVKSRLIPEDCYKLFWYTDTFKKFVNNLVPEKFSEGADHPRLLIPYFDTNGVCFAFQGRSLAFEIPKYYTIRLDEISERIFGLDRLDLNKPILVVEGPIDSLFLPNAIAVSGSSFNTPLVQSNRDNVTIVFDNDRRNPQIINSMKSIIEAGYKICIWPNTFQHKDINEAIINGCTAESLLSMIQNNTCSGPEARLKLAFY